MNRTERALLVGMGIGDGYINHKGELRIKHCSAQRPYLEYKAGLLKKIFKGRCEVVDYDVTLKSNGKTYKQSRILKSNKYFKQIRRWLYSDSKKVITRNILDMLTPEALAIWYMDDGSMGRNKNKHGRVSSVYTTLNTYCSEEEADIIIDYFHKTHNVKCVKGLCKGAYIIRFNTKASHNFVSLIGHYIIPTMRYKIRHIDKLRLHER